MLQQLRKNILVNPMAANPEACLSLFVPGNIVKVTISWLSLFWLFPFCVVLFSISELNFEHYMYSFAAKCWFHGANCIERKRNMKEENLKENYNFPASIRGYTHSISYVKHWLDVFLVSGAFVGPMCNIKILFWFQIYMCCTIFFLFCITWKREDGAATPESEAVAFSGWLGSRTWKCSFCFLVWGSI